MSITRRSLIGRAAAATSVVLPRDVWALFQEPPPLASCRLADGKVVRLEAVTRGPVHRFKSGPYWQRLLARLPFPLLRALAGDPIHEIRGTTPDSLVFWITREVAFNRGSGGRCEVVNDQGCSYSAHPLDVCYPLSSTLVGMRLLECWEAPAAPRRGRKLGLRMFGFGGNCDLITANPWLGPYPVWMPEELPVTKESGHLGVTLTSLATGLEIFGAGTTTFPMNPVLSEAHIRLTWRGRQSADWLPVGVALRDPTGNVLVPSVDSLIRHEYEQDFLFYAAFCADEPIWKLCLELAPCTLASIDPADLWTISSLPLPPDQVFSRATAQFSRHGTTLHLRGIAGPWASVPSDDNPLTAGASSRPEFSVHLKCSPPAAGVRLLLLRAVDDRGRSIQPPGTGDSRGGCDQCVFTLQMAPGAKEVTLVFAVVKSRFVEFVVRPTRAPDLPKSAWAHCARTLQGFGNCNWLDSA